ncbi:MAG: hypothetical protein D6765_15215 [Bacteroidetes bacterium]|nr:MAG: hypothetical protein D6765_15215 [Bacteroidota bacterium]
MKRAFEKYGPLPPEDVIGILKVIRRSIKTWGYGPNQRGYLIYLQDFLGKVGVHVQKLSAEEYQTMFGEEPPALNRPTPKENDF